MATESNNLESRVQQLHAEVTQILRSAERKTRRMTIMMLILIMVIAGYWSYIYQKVSLINADTVTQMAYQRTLDYVHTQQPEFANALKTRAPEVFNYAEAQLMQAPEAASAYLKRFALERTQFVLDSSEPAISKVITDALQRSRDAMIASGGDPKDPAQVERLIDKMAERVDAEIKTGFDKVYTDYDARAQEAVTYLNTLAEGKNLDRRQQHVRNVVVSFLAVAEKRKAGN
jgi:hypothetical protein